MFKVQTSKVSEAVTNFVSDSALHPITKKETPAEIQQFAKYISDMREGAPISQPKVEEKVYEPILDIFG
ncbi:MAG: hypothetical protein R3Y28_02295 [Candidatus Gastranaerophilales bacterium]